MRIAFFIASLQNSGGTERVTTVLANELSAQGYEVSIVCWSGGNSSFFPLNKTVACYYLYKESDINIYAKYLPSLIHYRRLIKKLNPAIVIDVCVPLSIITIPMVALTKIKVVSWEHFNVKVSWNMFTAKIARLLVSKFANKVVVLTSSDENEYIRRYKAKNIVVIPNPITIKVEQTSPLTGKNVLAIGRLTHQKGFDLLLQAWKRVVLAAEKIEGVRDWKLLIVGGGDDEIMLKEMCRQLELNASVEFIAPTKNIEALYTKASVFVMSSRFEGLPLALIEAKAFGLPTISFDCETGPREIITNEKDGLLVPDGDVEMLSQGLLRLITCQKDREVFGKASQEKSKKYELTEVVNKWKDVIFEL